MFWYKCENGWLQETNGCHIQLTVRSLHVTFIYPVWKVMNVTFNIPMDYAEQEERNTLRNGFPMIAKRVKKHYLYTS